MAKQSLTIVVSGLTRCGSSMVMQMLYAGGCPVSCSPGNELISGEHEDQLSALREIALGLTSGKAIKCLDPNRFPLPPDKKYAIIWMKRDFKEQAKSITKFMQMLLGVQESKRAMVRKFEQSLPAETRKSLQLFSNHPIIQIEFENIINNPKTEAKKIANFLKEIIPLDIDKMASVVIDRSTNCYSGMLESVLIARSQEIEAKLDNTTKTQHDEKLPAMPSVCECVYEYNDDHHGLLVWQCPLCDAQEEQTDA